MRRKIVERMAVDPACYSNMSASLEDNISERKAEAGDYEWLIEKHIEPAKEVPHPEENEEYPNSIEYGGTKW